MIWIRADGNAKIGAGHLMRCMAAAEELVRLAGRDNLCFACADEDSGALVREHGFPCRVLGTSYRDPESELPQWEAFLSTEDVILVDSYFVTDAYLSALGTRAYTVLMDDLGRRRYPVHCVVNYNAPADPERYRELYRGSGTKLLIGSGYTPLRRQFGKKSEVGSVVREVLVTTGGGDGGEIAGKILKRIYRDDFSFHLVLGRFCQDPLELRECNLHVHRDVKDMAGLMGRCQLAVTAGGSTVYELAAVGVPFLCFSCAENQEALVEYLGEKRIAASAGAWHKDAGQTLARIGSLFEELSACPGLREGYRERAARMVDGKGAQRLALAILGMAER